MTADATLSRLFWNGVRRGGRAPLFRQKHRGIWKACSWTQAGEAVADVAAGLLAAGLAAGDVVVILARATLGSVCADLGARAAAGVTCRLYLDTPPGEIAAVLARTRAAWLFVDDPERLVELSAVIAAARGLKGVFVLEGEAASGAGLADLRAAGAAARARDPGLVERASERQAPEDVALLAMAPDEPGGYCALTHAQALASARALATLAPARGERLALGSLASIGERMAHLELAILTGATVNFPEGDDTWREDLREIRPEFVCGPPELWLRLREDILGRLERATPFERWAFAHAGGAMALRKARAEMGLDRLRLGLCWPGPVSPAVGRWHRRCGVDLRDCWGAAATAGIALVGGEAGGLAPLPTLQAEIGADDELRLSGAFVAAAGGLGTGVRARRGEQGRLHLCGGIEEPIGHAGWVERLRESEMVQDALLVGEPDPSALILLDAEAAQRWARARGLDFASFAALAASEALRAEIAEAVERANSGFAPGRRVRAFRVFDRAFAAYDEELTRAGRLNRRVVLEKYPELAAAGLAPV